MSLKNILPHQHVILNFLVALGFQVYFSKPVLNHLINFITGVTQKGFSGTTTDIHRLSYNQKHRTTVSHFLSKGVWDERHVQNVHKEKVLSVVKRKAKRLGNPIFFIADDSICQKTKPLSQAESFIEGTSFHFSHTEGKSVWGHQVVATMLKTADLSLPYGFELYDPESGYSKIDHVCNQVEEFPDLNLPAYVLVDSWYTSARLVNICAKKGLHLIGALKTNRIIYPFGLRTSLQKFATHLRMDDLHLVTVDKDSYWVYRYEGPLNDIENAVVLLSWPKGAPLKEQTLRCYISTDISLSNQTILEYYQNRWVVETFFREVKQKLAFNRYQLRNTKSIKRFWTLIFLSYLYCSLGHGVSFNQGLQQVRLKQQESVIIWIYTESQKGTHLEEIKKYFKVA